MKTDGRLPKLSTASNSALPNRPRRGFRKRATAALSALGSLACLLAVAYGQERAPAPLPITPPPRGLAPADTSWTAPEADSNSKKSPQPLAIPAAPSAPTVPATKAKTRPVETGTASDLPEIAPKTKAPTPAPKTVAQPAPRMPAPVAGVQPQSMSREIMRVSYQETVPLQNVPLDAVPPQPEYAPSMSGPPIPPAMPSHFPPQVAQQVSPPAAPQIAPPTTPLPSYGLSSTTEVRPAAPPWTPVGPSRSATSTFRPQTANDFLAQVQAQGEPPVGPTRVPGKVPELMPQPRPAGPFAPEQVRLPRMPDADTPLGRTPVPTAKDIADYNAFVGYMIDPHLTLDLVKDRVRIMQLKVRPLRTQIGDANIVEYNFIGQKATDIAFIGKQIGTTVFNVWFEDPADRAKEKILSFLVRVIPDPEELIRLENVYKRLEKEINCQFPNSVVCLKLVGDKVCVSGQAFDVAEASKILQLVAANSPSYQQYQTKRAQNRDKQDPSKIPVAPIGANGIPGLDDYLVSPDANIINQLRIGGEQQVMLRVTVAEVNRSAARSIGVNFSVRNNNGTQVLANNTGQIGQAVANGVAGTTSTILGNLPVALDNGQISIAINALRTLNYARSLAEPNLVALNGQTATFQAGGQFPVPVVAGNTFNQSQGIGVSFVPFGVQLNFTPFITEKDRIRLNMAASVSTRDLSTGASIANSNVPGLNTRNFQTTVELREGQTLAVAGLIQNNLGADANRVPFFGDIPVINNLTGFSRTSMAEQELIVLVSPELHHSMDHKQTPPLPGADLFEPGDLEFYLLGRLEGRRGQDYRSPVRNDMERMIRFHRCEEQYIFGPTGFGPNHP